MSSPQTEVKQDERKVVFSEKKRVHLDVPRVVNDLLERIAEYYGLPKVDVLTALVFSEASRLGIGVIDKKDEKK